MTLSVHVSGDAYHLGERDWLYLGQVLWFSFFLQYFYFREFSSDIQFSACTPGAQQLLLLFFLQGEDKMGQWGRERLHADM